MDRVDARCVVIEGARLHPDVEGIDQEQSLEKR
jgi:hypothetical protein